MAAPKSPFKQGKNDIQNTLVTMANNRNNLSNNELQCRMQNAHIGAFKSDILNCTNKETAEIKRWKEHQPQMNKALNQIRQNVDEYANALDTTEAADRSAYNLKASTSMAVHAVNGLMANAVMKAEMPQHVSDAYQTAHALSTQSMEAVGSLGVHAALYNQNNLLRDLYGENAIQNDQNARADVNAISVIDKKMRRQRRMRFKSISDNAKQLNGRYTNLRENPNVPWKMKQRIKRQQNLWEFVIGVCAIATVLAIAVGIGYAGYVGIGSVGVLSKVIK